jgi:carboxymethylenebutenolidase
VEFPSNGSTASGYLSKPAGGSGPGVVLVQEWWGVEPALKATADQLAGQGFVVLIPDLYHGEFVVPSHEEMDTAAGLSQAMLADRAALDMSGAVDYLAGHEAVTSESLGVVGFCMGGMLTFLLAANRPDKIKAAVPFYGYPSGDQEPDWSPLQAKIRGHMAGHDNFFGADGAVALEKKLQGLGKDVQFTVHQEAGHAFMAAHNALGTHDAALADKVWPDVFAFLHGELG